MVGLSVERLQCGTNAVNIANDRLRLVSISSAVDRLYPMPISSVVIKIVFDTKNQI